MDTNKPLASIIIPARNEGENVRRTLDSLFSVKTGYPFEVVVVNDGSEDECCEFVPNYEHASHIRLIQSPGVGASRSRNLGASIARGEYLVFCDAHLFFEDEWLDRLLPVLESGTADAINPGISDAAYPHLFTGYGYSWIETLEPRWNMLRDQLFASPLLAGGCLAVRKEAFWDVGGFDSGFQIWGREDEEISLKLWLFGYKCYVLPEVRIRHVFRNAHPYRVTFDHIYYNTLRMAYSHFSPERIEKCKRLIKYRDPQEIESAVLADGVLEQRKNYFARRRYDDDWFMKTFHIPF